MPCAGLTGREAGFCGTCGGGGTFWDTETFASECATDGMHVRHIPDIHPALVAIRIQAGVVQGTLLAARWGTAGPSVGGVDGRAEAVADSLEEAPEAGEGLARAQGSADSLALAVAEGTR